MTDLQSEAQPDEQWRIVEPLTLTPLLTAALEVFHELGYHGASVRDIAKRAGVTVPTLYYHHGNKQGILVALMEPGIENVTARASAAVDAAAKEIAERVQKAIQGVLANQSSSGSFGLWGPYGGGNLWLDSYVTDFLTRAREKGFAVPDIAFRQAIDHLRNSVANADEPEKDGGRELADREAFAPPDLVALHQRVELVEQRLVRVNRRRRLNRIERARGEVRDAEPRTPRG